MAELLDAPVATTYMGKGALPDDHPLAAGCGCDEAAFQELLAGADLVLCVGTELGAETTGQYALRFSGRLIQIDAAPERIGATYPALGTDRRREGDLERAPRPPRAAPANRRARARGRAARAHSSRFVRRDGARARSAGGHRSGAPSRRDHRLGHDDPRLLGRAAHEADRRAAVSLPPRLGHARLRLARGDRRERRQPGPGGARGRGRRRAAVRPRRARHRGSALARTRSCS